MADAERAQNRPPAPEENSDDPEFVILSRPPDHVPSPEGARKVLAKQPGRIGRPTKFTPETRDLIINGIGAGAHIGVVIQAAGIGRHTYYDWMAAGREASVKVEEGFEISDKEREFMDFAIAVVQAEASAELRLVGHLSKAASKDWRAALAMLKLRYPTRWREIATTEIISDGSGGLPAGRDIDQDSIASLQRELEIRARAKNERDIVEAEVIEE